MPFYSIHGKPWPLRQPEVGGFSEMGIALVDDIWVQDFGAPIRKD